MWLLNTASLALELVENPEEYTYAVLSHTWERGEVTFQEIADRQVARQKPGLKYNSSSTTKIATFLGFSKIEQTCRLALACGIKYAWVDTCCIDKSSSAELTEAINSMFRWYENAVVCFVFLCDLPALDETSIMNDYFPRCRWFSRGWTLQELIASNKIEFYDQGWNSRGDKVSLQLWLSEITGIDIEVLRDSDALPTVSVARRMSWAAMRVTSRLEDRAYSLFGIFDVHLPLIYGEGLKAFTRLQEAIAQDNNDLSLLAWTSSKNGQEYRGVLARSPTEFKRCGSVQQIMDPAVKRTDFSMTNKGFHITSTLNKSEEDFLLSLQCVDSSIQQAEGSDGIIAIRIVRTAHGYVRYGSDRLVIVSRANLQLGHPDHIYIPKDVSFTESQLIKTRLAHRFVFEFLNRSSLSCKVTRWPNDLWDPHTSSFLTDGYENFTGLLEIDIAGSRDDPKQNRPRNNSPPERPIPTSLRRREQRRTRSPSPPPWSPFPRTQDSLAKLNRLEVAPQLTIDHHSTYVVVFGLELPKRTRRSTDTVEKQPLRPWAAIYGDTDEEVFSQFTSEERLHGFPHGLNHFRELLKVSSNGRLLPKTLLLDIAWYSRGRKNSLQPEKCQPVDNSRIQLSLSTETIENSSVGMFRLVLAVDAMDQT